MQLFMTDKYFPQPEDFKENLCVGITGGIGSGKSVVSRILRCNGFTVYDCDSEAKKLMRNDRQLKGSLIKVAGENIYDKSGELDRFLLAAKIFSDNELRKKVNSLVHEAVREDLSKRKKGGIFFVESAILATGGIVPMCDMVWIVEAPDKLKMERIERRDNLSEEMILKRMKTQEREILLIPEFKRRIIRNDDKSSLINGIIGLLDELKSENNYKTVNNNIKQLC